jgi:hypothetical protein
MDRIHLLLLVAGFFFGWGANNLVYGRKGCDHCFVALVRGKKCSDCENNTAPNEVKSP